MITISNEGCSKEHSRVVGTRKIDRLPESLRELARKLFEDPYYEGNACKHYKNKEGALPGQGPFFEFVAKGNKQRAVLDRELGILYATLDHHGTYFEVA